MKTKDEIMQLSGWDLDAAVMMSRNIFYDGNIPHYSTDIAAAWELVEKMKEDEYWLSASYLVTLHNGSFRAVYEVCFRCVRAIRGRDDVEATAIEFPEAISRAFLLAMAYRIIDL